ncbi:MAG TPA: hypothetical protein PLM28_03425 [Fervidobacterium sp.]|nr:hypothetical protein [Fervidobacterium sp.]
MPGFWDYLSQTADRYNQIRSNLEKEQTELANMYGTQLNNMYSNAMSGINLMGGLLGQKLNTLLGLYGTQASLEEGERNRQNQIYLTKLTGEQGLEQTKLAESMRGLNAINLENTSSKNRLREIEYQTKLTEEQAKRTQAENEAKLLKAEKEEILKEPLYTKEYNKGLEIIKSNKYKPINGKVYISDKKEYEIMRKMWGYGYYPYKPVRRKK